MTDNSNSTQGFDDTEQDEQRDVAREGGNISSDKFADPTEAETKGGKNGDGSDNQEEEEAE